MTTEFFNLFSVVSVFFAMFKRPSEFEHAGIFVPGNLVMKPSYPVCNYYSVLYGLAQRWAWGWQKEPGYLISLIKSRDNFLPFLEADTSVDTVFFKNWEVGNTIEFACRLDSNHFL